MTQLTPFHGTGALKIRERGVSLADYLIGGCPVLQAIDRYGNCVKRIRLADDVDEEIARTWLEGLLEREDPAPRLQLVRATPAAATWSPALLSRILARKH